MRRRTLEEGGIVFLEVTLNTDGALNMISRFRETGGIHLDNIRNVLDAGAAAVGLGGNLVDKERIRQGDFDWLTRRAQAFREKIGETP
ncbi:hypothetical protein [Cohnella thailandensis]|uniref:Uncharacterized protein n=1 Tax=Cohnella thailandensis TaxID=557557 RepID=A0A841SWN3_9BACL|nr:hypothetical protein [Cohnella thailandensis]MBB6635652.1 hypothetical protein [Cohnella thailandensis]MBP1976029.1 2-keto-3-deoxy-6-phosphogluconate aldolase [Cohnella thailandensis]